MTEAIAKSNKEKVQTESLAAWFQNLGQGCIEIATGGGKTKIGLMAIKQLRDYFLATSMSVPYVCIVVPTEEMRDIDWIDEANKWGINLDHVDLVCFASLSKVNLSKYDLVIYDECHRLTLPNLKNLEKYQRANLFVLGLTATKPRGMYDDPERVRLLNKLLPTVYKLTTDEAVELGLIADFEVNVIKFDLSTKLDYEVVGKNKTSEKLMYEYRTRALQRATILSQKDKRKEGFKFAAMAKRLHMIQNLPSKHTLTKWILIQPSIQASRVIVFTGSIEQANKLGKEFAFHSKSKRDALENFQNKSSNLLIAVKSLNEGKNLAEPDIGIIAQVNSVERNLVQQIGRLVRIRYTDLTHKAKVYILVAKDTADEKWFNEAIADFDSKRISYTYVKIPEDGV